MNKETHGSDYLFLKDDVLARLWITAARPLATRGPIHGLGRFEPVQLFSGFGARERTTLDDL